MNSESMELNVIPQSNSGGLVEAQKQKELGGVMAAMAVAKRFPRDQSVALSNLSRACQRKGLAEISQYTYSRGGTEINGPSINLLRAVAQAWGNIQSGWQEVERRPGESTVRTWACDLESNTHEERTFIVKHWRDTKAGGYLIKDERDIYELLANQAARRVRGCLQSVIPQDIVELAVVECDKTLEKGSGIPLADRIRTMVSKFLEIGVSKEQIESKLGHKIEASKETEVYKLGKIFVSIRDGVGTVEDHFPSATQVAVENAVKKPTVPVSTDMAGADPGLAPIEVIPQPAQDSIQNKLAQFITVELGSSFDGMMGVLETLGWTKQIKGLSDCSSFDSIPDAIAKKLWAAKSGIAMELGGKV